MNDNARELSLSERVANLHEPEIWLPAQEIREHVVPSILATILALSIVFSISFRFVDRLVAKGASLSARRKVCYQMTNLTTNSILGLLGLYHELFVLPKQVEAEGAIGGFNELLFFSGFQLGFQLWAIPIGLFLVNESPAMLAHHVASIFVAAMSGFHANGFRYYTPFFYGLGELSSVPLAVMNTFKDNPEWIQKHPDAYLTIRLVFGASFIWIRIVMFVPRMLSFLHHHYLLFTSRSGHIPFYRTYMTIVFSSSVFLLTLQIYWGFLIFKGLAKIILKKDKSKPKTAVNGAKKKA